MTRMEQLAFDLATLRREAGEDFVVAPCNQDAVAWVERWPDWPQACLVIYGPPACGKTTLGKIWARRSDAVRVPPQAVGTLPSPELMGEARAVWLDDAENITDQEGLFHLLNNVWERPLSLLMTMTAAYPAAPFALPDLVSRVNRMQAARIDPPDDPMLEMLLHLHFSARQMRVGGEVIRYLLPRLERSHAAVQKMVSILDKRALSDRKSVTLPFVKNILENADISPR